VVITPEIYDPSTDSNLKGPQPELPNDEEVEQIISLQSGHKFLEGLGCWN